MNARAAQPPVLTRRRMAALAATLPMLGAAAAGAEPLRTTARRRNILFGSMITRGQIADPRYAALVARECAIVTPGLEAKFGATEPAEHRFSFAALDDVAAFAAAHGQAIHMHTLIWGVGLPAWAREALAAGRGLDIMRAHIAAVAGRYRGRVHAWDVVNEAVDPRWPADRNGIVMSPWWHGAGPDYLAEALHAARAADPTARLMLNDDDLEYDAPDRARKRRQYVRLVENLRRRGVPLDAFGLQAHLKPWLPFAEADYRQFLHELAGFGLKLSITEFDVNDRMMPADAAARDQAVAGAARRYFDVALDEPAVDTVILWGLSDRITWYAQEPSGRRADGLAPRPLPYDAAFTAKPLRAAIAGALAAARQRPALPG